MSGRALRRLPVLAHARYIGAHCVVVGDGTPKPKHVKSSTRPPGVAVETWLDAMERVVQLQGSERNRLHS